MNKERKKERKGKQNKKEETNGDNIK